MLEAMREAAKRCNGPVSCEVFQNGAGVFIMPMKGRYEIFAADDESSVTAAITRVTTPTIEQDLVTIRNDVSYARGDLSAVDRIEAALKK